MCLKNVWLIVRHLGLEISCDWFSASFFSKSPFYNGFIFVCPERVECLFFFCVPVGLFNNIFVLSLALSKVVCGWSHVVDKWVGHQTFKKVVVVDSSHYVAPTDCIILTMLRF